MHRFYAEKREGDLFTLSENDRHHADTVLRLKAGSAIEIFSEGQRYSARLLEDGKAQFLSPLPQCEPALQVTLFQGLPKGEKMEWIVQKAVELGVSRVVPVEMHRCVMRLKGDQAEKKRERWQKIAREAGKQSGRAVETEVAAPISLSSLCSLLPSFDAVLVPWEEAGALSLRGFADAHPSPATLGIVIGPEGGMERSEVEQMKAAGGYPVTLGPRILRTETAGVCALSCLMCLYGEMEQAPGGEGEA